MSRYRCAEDLSREWGSMWDWDWMERSDWPTTWTAVKALPFGSWFILSCVPHFCLVRSLNDTPSNCHPKSDRVFNPAMTHHAFFRTGPILSKQATKHCNYRCQSFQNFYASKSTATLNTSMHQISACSMPAQSPFPCESPICMPHKKKLWVNNYEHTSMLLGFALVFQQNGAATAVWPSPLLLHPRSTKKCPWQTERTKLFPPSFHHNGPWLFRPSRGQRLAWWGA